MEEQFPELPYDFMEVTSWHYGESPDQLGIRLCAAAIDGFVGVRNEKDLGL